MKPFSKLLLLLAGTTMAATVAWAFEWPQFRGPAHNGVVERGEIPTTWSTDENIRWKVSIPGRGWSSPIVWGEKIFITTAVLKIVEPAAPPQPGRDRGRRGTTSDVFSWEVYCLERASGKVLWNRVAVEGNPRVNTHASNTYASETPVTDGERLYVYFGMMGLFCYDLDGALLWKKDLGSYPMQGDWGTSTSPVLHGGLLFQVVDNESASFVVALDAKTGDERWRLAREEPSNWSTPLIWQNSQRTELVVPGVKARSYDPATGRILWELNQQGGRNIASPVADGDRLFIGNEPRGGGGKLFAVRAGVDGDITPAGDATTSAGVIWSSANCGIEMSSPLYYQGYIYVLARRTGMINCYHADTGEVAYYRTPLGGAGEFWATAWGYDGNIFCLDASGTTHVVVAGPTYQRLRENKLEEQCWATPAIVPGMIIIRGVEYLYCIENARPAA
jgi:outer membrane protein assembly factor BamB